MTLDQSVRPLTEWLESHTGQSLHIVKMEDGDTDTVHFQLERVSMRDPIGQVPDDYVIGNAVELVGSGTVSLNGRHVPLPSPVYEIALVGDCSCSPAGECITVQTDRAAYEIQASQ